MKIVGKMLFVSLITVLLIGSASAAIDVTNGQEISVNAKYFSTAAAVPGGTCVEMGNCEALWDISHGVYMNYQPSGAFSEFVALLASKGYPVKTTSTGVLSEDLSKYRILIISTTTSWNSPYTKEEVLAIRNFVDNGGKLLILGENTECPNENVNPVSQAFGITLGKSYLSPADLILSSLDTTHPSMNGVSSIVMRAAGEVGPGGSAQAIAWTGTQLPAIAAVDTNVVCTGDSNMFDNTYLGMGDNRKFATNLWEGVYCPHGAPEFPSLLVPAGMIIGLAGLVLFARGARRQ